VTSGGNNFNDFPDSQLAKFRIFIGWSWISSLLLNLYETSRFAHPYDGCPIHNGQSDKRTCLSVIYYIPAVTFLVIHCRPRTFEQFQFVLLDGMCVAAQVRVDPATWSRH